MDATITALLSKLIEQRVRDADVIQWGAPVPSFGDVSRSKVATLGLNPSNREFVDRDGNELSGEQRRFHTLGSLGLKCWSDADDAHVDLIVASCRNYFTRNPYDGWFRQLDYIISGTRTSYYSSDTSACHLDLIPFATASKWTTLTKLQRLTLLEASMGGLAKLLCGSSVDVLVLNGKSVVNAFEEIAGMTLTCQPMPEWSLRRGSEKMIPGNSYTGRVRTLRDSDLRREILVLGFNHNIQSSFGVTKEVRDSIRSWVGRVAQEVGA